MAEVWCGSVGYIEDVENSGRGSYGSFGAVFLRGSDSSVIKFFIVFER